MVQFLMANWRVLVILVCMVILAILWLIGRKDIVKKVLLELVIDAENKWGAGTGKIKHDTVVGLITKQFPIVTSFIRPETIDGWITEMVKYIEDELGEDKVQQVVTLQGVDVATLKEHIEE